MEIRKIGKFHDIDQQDYISNPCVYPVLQIEYQNPINLIVDKVMRKYSYNIHSIYLRGSVAKGIAIHNISDIDFIILVLEPLSYEDKNFLYNVIEKEVCELYPFINGIELHGQDLNSLDGVKVQFLFKTQCICIFGEDIIPSLPRFKLGKDAIAHAFSLNNDIANTLKGLHTCGWIMKRLIRVGFELCMLDARCYTRDLYLCYEIFSRYYPQQTTAMKEALILAIQPTTDKYIIEKSLIELGHFLVQEVREKLEPYRL